MSDQEREALNEFHDARADGLDKSRDWDDVSYYAGEVLVPYDATDEELQQKVRGVIRLSDNADDQERRGEGACGVHVELCKAGPARVVIGFVGRRG